MGYPVQRTTSKVFVAVFATSLAVLSLPSAALAATTPSTDGPTAYALSASGYASRVDGGNLPAGSGKSAFAVIGCTNLAGLSTSRSAVSIPIKDLVTISGARTRAWTTEVGGKVSAWSSHKIAKATFVNIAGLGTLSLDGIASLTHSYHDATGYHATTTSSVGSITLTLLGIPVDFDIPPIGQTLSIPGVADISLGAGTTNENAAGASATNDAVKIDFVPSDTTIYLAHAHSQISGGVRSALFRGTSSGVSVNALDGALRVAKQPFLVMKCRGTGGHEVDNNTAAVDLGALGSASGLATSEWAKQTTTKARSWQQADVAGISLAGGALQISGVTGRASAAYNVDGSVTTSTAGTTVASVMLNGEALTLPPQGTLDIPGIASLTTDVESQITNGVSVIALQITMLDGTGATINLAAVRTQIKPSGL